MKSRPVLPGEVYRENDPRMSGPDTRFVLVLTVDREYVHVGRVNKSGEGWLHAGTRSTRIRRSAFHSKSQRGFTLVDSPMPTRRITIDIDGADDVVVHRLFLAIEQEARDFKAHHTQVTVTADGSHHTVVTGSRTTFDD